MSDQDVIQTVLYCQENAIPLTVFSSGSCFEESSNRESGLVLDISLLKELSYDKTDQAVWAGAGWNVLDLAQALYNISDTPRAAVLSSGVYNSIVGFSQNAGWGFLTRKFGAGVDQILELRVVIAGDNFSSSSSSDSDGDDRSGFALRDATAGGSRDSDNNNLTYTAPRVITCNRSQHSELFWALRGGGVGGLAVVTAVKYVTVPLPEPDQFLYGLTCWRWAGAGTQLMELLFDASGMSCCSCSSCSCCWCCWCCCCCCCNKNV